MSAPRFPDWTERLEPVLEAQSLRAFAYGNWDCCLFVADAALAMTGFDPAADYRGAYGDYGSGLKILRAKTGKRNLAGWADLFYPRTAPALAHRGDWGLVKSASDGDGKIRPVLGLIDGDVLRVAGGALVARHLIQIAWSIG
jgi:hypothetical protein